MRLLLDTHIAIWAATDSKRLSLKARQIVGDGSNEAFVSAVSVAEIAIKRSLGPRRNVPPFSAFDALDIFKQVGFRLIDLTPAHSAMLETLPLLHNDPFDRLLIAQAFAEPLCLVTHDTGVAAYGGSILLV